MSEVKLTKNRIWMVGLILIVAGVSGALLTCINIYTTPLIALNEEIKLKRSVLDTFAIRYEKESILDIFDEQIKIKTIDGTTFFDYYKGNKLVGVAFEAKGPGFWGTITTLVALDAKLKKIKGIEILKQEETPGLGGRIGEKAFKDQFKGKPIDPSITFDAITGATMTSKAFEALINDNVQALRKKYKNG